MSSGEVSEQLKRYSTIVLSAVGLLLGVESLLGHAVARDGFLWASALLISGGALIVVAFFVVFKREPGRVGNRALPYYPAWARHSALAFLLILPLLGGYGWLLQREVSPGQIVVLVADFEGPESDRYRITELVIAHLSAALQNHSDVSVQSLGIGITEQQGSAVARAAGREKDATIVVWGWYGVTRTSVTLSYRIELLKQPEVINLSTESSEAIIQGPASELDHFRLQGDLSSRVSSFSLAVLSLLRYSAGDWDGATAAFEEMQLSATDDPELKSKVASCLGFVYMLRNEEEKAVAAYQMVAEPDQDAVYFQNLAAALLGAGETEQAEKSIERAFARGLNDAGALNIRAMIRFAQGKNEQAFSDLAAAIRLSPSDGYLWANRGYFRAREGNIRRALSDFNAALRNGADRANMLVFRAKAYSASREYDKAIADVEEALEIAPALPGAYQARGEIQYTTGDLVGSLKSYTAAVVLSKGSSKGEQRRLSGALLDRGIAFARLKRYDAALADLNRAELLWPRNANVYYNRGLVHFERGDIPSAMADLELSRQIDGCSPNTLDGLGMTYESMGDFEKAAHYYRQALQADPKHIGAHRNLGELYARLGRYEESVRSFSKGVELTSGRDVLFLGKRAMVFLQSAQWDAAIKDLDEVVSKDPNVLEANFLRAKAHLGKLECEAAVADLARVLNMQFETASWNRPAEESEKGRALRVALLDVLDGAISKKIEAEPENASLFSDRAGLRFLKGEYQSALVDINTAIDKQPEEIMPWFNRAQLYVMMNDCGKAAEDLRYVLGKLPTYETFAKEAVRLRVALPFASAVDR